MIFHPVKFMVYVLLAALTMLFVALTAAYLYQRLEKGIPPLPLPSIFIYNSSLLLLGSFFIDRANKAYLADHTRHYQYYLWCTLGVTLLFGGIQFVGWAQLQAAGQFLTTSPSASYVYVLSWLHLLHVLGGIVFLVVFIGIAYKYMRSPVSVLVYFSDPNKRLRLRLLTIYWHFLDGLWLYLVLFFALTRYM